MLIREFMTTKNNLKPHVNVGRISHPRASLFIGLLTAGIVTFRREPYLREVSLTCLEDLHLSGKPPGQYVEQLVLIIPDPVDERQLTSIMEALSVKLFPSSSPSASGESWPPPLKKRVPLKYLPGHKHRVAIHSSRARR